MLQTEDVPSGLKPSEPEGRREPHLARPFLFEGALAFSKGIAGLLHVNGKYPMVSPRCPLKMRIVRQVQMTTNDDFPLKLHKSSARL